MALVDSRAARVIFTALLFLLGIGFLYFAFHTLIAFLFAILLAYLMNPAVTRIERWTRGRGTAIALMYAVVLMLLAVFFFFIGPGVARQAQRLAQAIPGLIENIGSGQIAEEIGARHGWSLGTQQLAQNFLISHRADILAMAQGIGLRVADAAKQSWLLVVVPILAVFFLKDGPRFRDALLAFVTSERQRQLFHNVIGDLNLMLAQFIRAQLTMVLLSFIAYMSFLGLMRVPYALVLSSAGGVMEFIPLVGPLVTAAVILSVATLTGYSHWIVLALFLAAWRLTVDYVLVPRIMGNSMELHPLATIFGVLAGGEIGGVLGIYLSIPVMAALRIVWKRWQPYSQSNHSALVEVPGPSEP
ncbi:MAG TPA: AI-2E family transporter [Terriglobales bacterium]